MFPAAVAWHMIENTALQLVTIDSRTDFLPPFWAEFNQEGTPLARQVQGSLQSRGKLDGHALDEVNLLHAAVALLSFLACLALIRSCLASRLYWPAGLIAWIMLALVANAFAGGALSGVFGRYQGRVVWLLPMGAIAAAIALARNRPPVMARASRAKQRAVSGT